jgi:hypothetical protein
MVMQKQMITSDILGSMRMALRPTNSDGTSDDREKVVVEVSEYDDGMVASEGFVLRKKQFKEGTRQSFINTFHQFQEKEELLGDNSTSLKNTIMLHSKLVKGNALLSSNTSFRTDPSSALMTTKETTTAAVGDDTASLKNTMLLHSKLVKGNALSNGNTSARADPSSALMMAEEPTTIGDDAASLKNTMLLHSKLVKGNALLKNKNNKLNDA